ncbi:MAG: Exosome complex component Csl4 [Promethearchaeota archaeon]|nr:MAG: Exosome complex component Csl4 [Candidatus Lokiarchaeota archaeon]
MNDKKKDIILTGEYVGVVEEFLPDTESTYIKDGKIYASKSGIISKDLDRRKINIKTHQESDRKIPKIGDIVIGVILFQRKYSVGLNFYTLNRKLHFNSYFFGNIHVSQISNRYIEKITDAFQKTDIIRAKVIKENGNEYELTTIGKDLGVIHSDCSICGTELDRIGFNKLRCPMCGNMENKKLASDYREVAYNLKY